jgi:predicted sulfurtransferase
MIADIADGMTDTETEKFQSLVDDVEFSDEDSYKEKLQTIKESYFGTGKVETEETEVLTEEGSQEVQEVSGQMAKYMSAIKKDNSRAKK